VDAVATRKLIGKPYCIKHSWSHWTIFEGNKDKLIKRCRKCPATLTVKEFMERKNNFKMIFEKANMHIDLFNF
jgi:hypothetical protein